MELPIHTKKELYNLITAKTLDAHVYTKWNDYATTYLQLFDGVNRIARAKKDGLAWSKPTNSIPELVPWNENKLYTIISLKGDYIYIQVNHHEILVPRSSFEIV
jgi:hypothetical protein